jgi:hypothetical protein
MKTLILDIGTKTGWALLRDGMSRQSGTLLLAKAEELELQRQKGGERTQDLRFCRLYTFLNDQVTNGVLRIVFEDVLFTNTQMQGQLWASLRTAIWAVAIHHPTISVYAVPSVTLKRFATKNGKAQKADMAQALLLAEPACFTKMQDVSLTKTDGTLADDNEVDAIWLSRFTESVDRGENSFMGVRERQLAAKVAFRVKRAERKRAVKEKREAELADERAKQAAIKTAIQSLGKCCGKWRRLWKRRAICSECGSNMVLPKLEIKPPNTKS